MLTKPCPGGFDEATLQSLEANLGRAQWLSHPCSVCGQRIGAVLKAGKWIPESHWASIAYAALERKRPTRKYA